MAIPDFFQILFTGFAPHAHISLVNEANGTGNRQSPFRVDLKKRGFIAMTNPTVFRNPIKKRAYDMSIIDHFIGKRCLGKLSNSHQQNLQTSIDKLEPRLAFSCLAISEIVASNKLGIRDNDGDRSDWIEVRNECNDEQSLDGWYLTDRANRPTKWQFPDVTLPAHEQLVVFASGKDRTDPDSELHANFKLRRSGEYLALVDPTGAHRHTEFFPAYPQQREDISYGDHPEFNGLQPVFFAVPSPAQLNSGVSYRGVVEEVALSSPTGLKVAPFAVDLESNTPGATIIFTTDGSIPSLDNGIQVAADQSTSPSSHSLYIDSTLLIRAIAVKDGFLASKPSLASYLFVDDITSQSNTGAEDDGWPERWGAVPGDYAMATDIIESESNRDLDVAIRTSLESLPSISIALDTDELFGEHGIYSNPTQRGFEWERVAAVEFFDAESQETLSLSAGLRIHGDASRSLYETRKKSFRLHFRDQYDGKFSAPEFLGSDFSKLGNMDSLVLRANFHDGWQEIDAEGRAQYIRDEWYRETFREMGQLSASGMFVHLYLNGYYWGLYNLVERPDESFASRHLGGDESDWHIAKRDIDDPNTKARWENLLHVAAEVNSSDQSASDVAFDQLLGESDTVTEPLIDMINYIDYMILNIYGGTGDWPSKNWIAVDREGDGEGFKFLPWDAEISLHRGSPLNTNRTGVRTGVAEIYDHLKTNERFRDMFAERVLHHFSEGGALYVDQEKTEQLNDGLGDNRPAARYAEIAEEIETALVAESSRWGDQHRVGQSYKLTDWRAERDYLLSEYFPQRSSIVWQQLLDADLVDQAFQGDKVDTIPTLPISQANRLRSVSDASRKM